MSDEFPLCCGFEYDEENDEFTRTHLDGSIIIWRTLYNPTLWEISFVDKEEYQHFLGKGDEEDIKTNLLVFTRDSKISEILG